MSNDVERLRGERADLQHKLAHWQRVAEESGTMVARRVEAMREAALAECDAEAALWKGDPTATMVTRKVGNRIRALPATPAPEKCCPHVEHGRAGCRTPGCECERPGDATPAPGPSAEAEWIVAESEGGASVGVGVYRSTDGENARPLVYFGYEEQGTDDEDEAIRRANQRARVVAAALNALTRAPGGQDA